MTRTRYQQIISCLSNRYGVNATEITALLSIDDSFAQQIKRTTTNEQIDTICNEFEELGS